METKEREPLLNDKHREDLKSSGIDPDWFLHQVRFGETLYQEECEKTLGFSLPKECREGLAFYYTDEKDEVIWTRIKPDVPLVKPDGSGRPAKYLSPKGSVNRLYFPPVDKRIPHNIWTVIKDSRQPLVITEGEKKTLKANLEGIPCLGLAGVWSWKTRDLDGDSRPLPDLDLVQWKGRKVFICFDSDVREKPEVQLAMYHLKKELTGRGATVRQVLLPVPSVDLDAIAAELGYKPVPGVDFPAPPEKVGLDDYLLRHSREEFDKLPRAVIVKPVAIAPTRPFRQNPDIPALEWTRGGVYGDEIHTIYTKLSGYLAPTECWYRYGEDVIRIDSEKRITYHQTADTFPAQLVGTVEIIFFKEVMTRRSGVTVPAGHGLFPTEHAKAYLKSPEVKDALPEVRLATKTPIFTEDWRLINEPGYHERDLVYYLGEPVEVRDGTHLLEEMLAEVAWKDPETDKANFLAMLLTGVTMGHWTMRQKPMVVFNADRPRAGKTTLAELLCAIVDGVRMSPVSYTRNGEEFEKRLVSRYIGNPENLVVVVDNVRVDDAKGDLKEIQSTVLEMDITAPLINHRILGTNKEVNRPNNLIFAMTINNAILGHDLAVRALPVNLRLGNTDPADRLFPKGDLIRWALEKRTELVGELLGMVTRWRQAVSRKGAEKPRDLASHSAGYDWAETMDWILRTNGYVGFLTNLEESFAEYDPGAAVLEQVLLAGGMEGQWTAGDLLKKRQELLEPLFYGSQSIGPPPGHLNIGEVERWKARELGRWLKKRVGSKHHAGFRVHKLCHRDRSGTNPTVYWFEMVQDLTKSIRVPHKEEG